MPYLLFVLSFFGWVVAQNPIHFNLLKQQKPYHQSLRIDYDCPVSKEQGADTIYFRLNWKSNEIKDKAEAGSTHLGGMLKSSFQMDSLEILYQDQKLNWDFKPGTTDIIAVVLPKGVVDHLAISYVIHGKSYHKTLQHHSLYHGFVWPQDVFLSPLNSNDLYVAVYHGKSRPFEEAIDLNESSKFKEIVNNGSHQFVLKSNKSKIAWESDSVNNYLNTFPPISDSLKFSIIWHNNDSRFTSYDGLYYHLEHRDGIGVLYASFQESIYLAIAEIYYARVYPEQKFLALAKAYEHYLKYFSEERHVDVWNRAAHHYWTRTLGEQDSIVYDELSYDERFYIKPLLAYWLKDSSVYNLNTSTSTLHRSKSLWNKEEMKSHYSIILPQEAKVPMYTYGLTHAMQEGRFFDTKTDEYGLDYFSIFSFAPVLPVISVNNYDGMGLRILASSDELMLGENTLSYFLSPGYGLKSKAFQYEALVRLKSYGLPGKISLWQNSFKSRRNHAGIGGEGYYQYQTYQLNSDIAWKMNRMGTWKWSYGASISSTEENINRVFQNDSTYSEVFSSNRYYVLDLRTGLRYQKGLNDLELQLRYRNLEGTSANFQLLEAQLKYKRIYTQNSKGITITWLGGNYLVNNSFQSRHFYNFSSGANVDYLYEGVYFGRSETEGVLAQQVNRGTFFKDATLRKTSGSWYTNLSVVLDFPRKIPLQFYSVGGWYPFTLINGNTNESFNKTGMLLESGITLSLWNNNLKIHFPFYNFDSEQPNGTEDISFGKRISFELNFFKIVKKDTEFRY